MLKFGWLFYLAKYLEQRYISAYGVRQGASSPTLNFGTASLSRNRKLKVGILVGIYEY